MHLLNRDDAMIWVKQTLRLGCVFGVGLVTIHHEVGVLRSRHLGPTFSRWRCCMEACSGAAGMPRCCRIAATRRMVLTALANTMVRTGCDASRQYSASSRSS